MALDRKQILAAAFELLDAEGLEGLTMRRLAQSMDIQAPSLYWHFNSRRALLESMADAMLDEVARRSSGEEDWREVVLRIGRETRAAFLAHRDGAKLFAGTYPISENVFRAGDAMMTPLRNAGLSPTMAGWATFTLIYFVIGFVIEEQSVEPFEGKVAPDVNLSAVRQSAQAFAEQASHPTLAEALPNILDEDFDRRFEFGLDLIVRGMQSHLQEASQSGASAGGPRRSRRREKSS
ncbi:MAG TPA: TetR/AcrR family transcriptional regulator C-terminal domain-containing protein [Steroidobacter sp.]|uniref:TetR/AcrR family transcriptional regulator C-terminal domain-containing protein n=1 Tax=Steroidobacter sp. TaxID=1978227 RepID=UPI002ED81D5A